MFLLTLVAIGSTVGSVKPYEKDLFSVFHLGDSAGGGNSGFHRIGSRRPKFVDVYTNHPDQIEVEKSFYKNYRGKSKGVRTNMNSPNDRKDTLNFQNLDDVFSSPTQHALQSEHGLFESGDYDSTRLNFGNRLPEYSEDEYHYADSNKYHYPHSPYTSSNKHRQTLKDKENDKRLQDKDEKNFVLLQSHLTIPDSENYGSFYAPPDFGSALEETQNPRPNFFTKKSFNAGGSHSFEEKGHPLNVSTGWRSHIQRIPMPNKRSTTVSPESTESDPNKYEEIDLGEQLNDNLLKTKSTNNQISNLLKKYITNLFIKKYANKKVDEGKLTLESSVLDFGDDVGYLRVSNVSKHLTDPKSGDEFKTSNVLWDLKNKTIKKIKNLLSIFTVIKFDNTECNATNWAGTWQGVCYTSDECDGMNGTALGNCASGYGVCCVFRGTCDSSSSNNCTYFKSPNYPDYYPSDGNVVTPTTTAVPTTDFPTPDPRLQWYYYKHGNGDEELDNVITGRQTSESMFCTFSLSKSDPAVNQVRIDFIDLDLASPTNGTCISERLVITGQNSNDQIPVICGYNTGQHVYVDVSDLNDPLQIMVLSTTGSRKRFKLRICQYTDSCSTSQSNCLQYYTGVTGVIESFNYDQALMFNRSQPGYLNNLNYAICIRREAGYCSVTYTNTRNGQMFPFQLVNRLNNGQLTVPRGQAGVDILNCPDDYIIIDGTRLCGDRFNDGSTVVNFSMSAPVTDTSAGPIVVNVRTNNNVTGLGFKLYYTQNPCTN